MAKNYVQHGHVLDLTAPAGGVVSGTPYLIGSIFGVAVDTVAQGLPFPHGVDGVWGSLPKKTAEAWAEGQALYWDDVNKYLTTTAGSLKRVAFAVVAAQAADTVGTAKIVSAV
jgi:predicted RecA/RadA family phage recombinase